jgi:Tfp pilus assembly protein PilP
LQTARGEIDLADLTKLTLIVHSGDQAEARFLVESNGTMIKVKQGDLIQSGSFSGRVVEILDEDVVLDRNGERWLLETGERLNEAFALPPEMADKNE